MPKGTMLNVGASELETKLGEVFPGYFATIAQKHMERYGTTREQMAQVSVKNHIHGSLNPYAQFQKKFTVEEVLNSPMIADPLTLYSCCPTATALQPLFFAAKKKPEKLNGRAIRIAASVLATGTYENQRDITNWDVEIRAAQQAYKMASLGPEDLDVVEVHDAFTICEILHYEGLGLCPLGEGGRLLKKKPRSLAAGYRSTRAEGFSQKGIPLEPPVLRRWWRSSGT